jgi:hypothetical protein
MIVKNPWFEYRDFNFPEKCIIYNDGEFYIARPQEHEFLYFKNINGCLCAFKDLAGHNKTLIGEVKRALAGEQFYYNQLIDTAVKNIRMWEEKTDKQGRLF